MIHNTGTPQEMIDQEYLDQEEAAVIEAGRKDLKAKMKVWDKEIKTKSLN